MDGLWKKLNSRVNEELSDDTDLSSSVRGTLSLLMQNINPEDQRQVLTLSHGDPAAFSCFRSSEIAEQAVVDALRSGKFNAYAPCIGIPSARRAVAEYLSQDLPYKLCMEDAYLTAGCSQAMEVVISVLACRGGNILLPRPGFPTYECRCAFSHLEVRHYDLLPDQDWKVDIDSVKNLADENTVAIVVINPGNPCGNVFSFDHLKQIAETAKELGILVVADEVFAHITFGSNPFVPMGFFASIVPVITLGSISKRWCVTGWRLGWIVLCDPTGTLQKSKIARYINSCLNITSDPVTFIQGALPTILKKTETEFFTRTINLLSETADILYDKINEIPCLHLSTKPQGSLFVMVKLDLSLLKEIEDDMDFCVKLAKEESAVVVPGGVVGLKNWIRMSFAVDPILLTDGIQRIKSFCERHAYNANSD